MRKIALILFVLLAATTAYASDVRPIKVTETAVNVTTSDAEVLAANSERRVGWLQNDSDTDIYCTHDGTAALNEGIFIAQAGGVYVFGNGIWAEISAINCIHGGAGNKVLLVVEGK